mgnify:CR=1 FL=1
MTEFTSTCQKPYDRHQYKITFSNGGEQLFDDYETMRSFWFSQVQLSKMVVSVIDPKPTKLGFA